MSDPMDPKAVEAAMQGDRRAFESLVRAHQASVRALCRRLAGSASGGDDIAQSAFLAAWKSRGTWRGGSFRSWVCAIAYREFLQQRRRHVPGRDGGDDPDDLATPAAADSERIDVGRAMASLDENERAAVALCLGAGLSHAEAAIIMHRPIGSVKSWVLRGRNRLRQILAAYEPARAKT